MMLAVFYGVTSGFLMSLTYLFFRKSFSRSHPAIGFLLQAVFGIVLWVPFSLIGGGSFTGLLSVLPIAFVSAVFSEALVIYAASKGEMAVTGAVIASYPIYTILFASLLLGERLSSLQWIFVALTIFGSILASFPRHLKMMWSEWYRAKRPLLALAVTLFAALSIGVADSISKPFIDAFGAHTFLLGLAVAQPIVALVYVLSVREVYAAKELVTHPMKHRMAIWAGLFSAASLIFFWLSFSETLASIASPLTGTTALFIAVWALVLDKEEFYPWKILGISSVVIGVIGVSLA